MDSSADTDELTKRIHRFMESKMEVYPELRVVPMKTPKAKRVKEHVPYKPLRFFSLGAALYSLRANQSLAK